jgi:hypothetical protein
MPEAFARWIAEQTGGPVPRFENVEPGDEQILPRREQRELDGVPSLLALRDHEDADVRVIQGIGVRRMPAGRRTPSGTQRRGRQGP